jgi:putative phosphoserine phosphatase/1-acylglycerol-3-phosphate O-acyltransferase
MWRDSQIARSGTIDVVVHPPIPTFDWTNDELEKRIAEVRDLYVDTLDEWPVHGADGTR